MTKNIVAGIYLERSRGMFIRARKKTEIGRKVELEYLDFEELKWDPKDPDEAEKCLREMAAIIGRTGAELSSIAIACYGPFLSLKRKNEKFGILHPTFAALPFQGRNLRQIVEEGLAQSGIDHDILINIHTDANACAIGEAIARDIHPNEVLVYILVTEGIGVGILEGRRPYQSALHPEIGPLHVRYLGEDKLKPKKVANQYGSSLSLLADNGALRKRLKKDDPKGPSIPKAIEQVRNSQFWDTRAFYVAQACLASVVLLAPHFVVIGADVDPTGSLVKRVRSHFESLMREREREGAPYYEYDEIKNMDCFISDPLPINGLKIPASLRATGAAGMCMEAALAHRGAEAPIQMKPRAI